MNIERPQIASSLSTLSPISNLKSTKGSPFEPIVIAGLIDAKQCTAEVQHKFSSDSRVSYSYTFMELVCLNQLKIFIYEPSINPCTTVQPTCFKLDAFYLPLAALQIH